jgi:Uma2 family endonuclease
LRESEFRVFAPGTTGWTVDDLDDPEIDRLWRAGRYEIVEGVLTQMAPAYLDGSFALQRLLKVLQAHFDAEGIAGDFAGEADFVVGRARVPRVDAIFLTDEQKRRQAKANAGNRRRLKYGRLVVAPLLAIESVSIGHEDHDRETKRRWYEEFGVPNYWILDAYAKSLECLKLRRGKYALDQIGRKKGAVTPSAFPGLVIRLDDLWR